MRKIICDLCEKNEADTCFKVQERLEIPFCEHNIVLPTFMWVRRDVCKECYDKLFKGEKDGIR